MRARASVARVSTIARGVKTKGGTSSARARAMTRVDATMRGEANDDERNQRRRARVAVVGAGAAGLAATRAMMLEGHDVVAFERSRDGCGGTWRYDASAEADALGTDARRRRVHGSMYASLRTNLPREVMGFKEFPFASGKAFDGDARRFCGHSEVHAYLEAYAERFGLDAVTRFGTLVVSVERVKRANEEEENRWSSSWEVTSEDPSGVVRKEMFDAVVVCNGHYSEPRVPEFDGAETWPGERTHSHNYRIPDGFKGKKVLLIGAMASGEDLSREIASVADAVYLSARTWQNPDWAKSTEGIGARGNVFRKPNVKRFEVSGGVEFEDGSVVTDIDACMYCTGYKYRFEFISKDIVSVEDNHVAPLFEHCVSANAPSLSFIGLPWKVVPFPQFELQSIWISRMLSGAVPMPSREEALCGAADLEVTLEPKGDVPRRHAHLLGDAQFEYNDRIAKLAGVDPLGSWRQSMYKKTGLNKRLHPELYRDTSPDDDEELRGAHVEFAAVSDDEAAPHLAH